MLEVVVLALGLSAAPPHVPNGAQSRFPNFESWFEKYRAGKIVFVHREEDSAGRGAGLQPDELGPGGLLGRGIEELRAAGNRAAAERLLELATFRFHPDPRQEKERHSLQQPWTVRALAVEALGRLRDSDTLKWLTTEVLLGKSSRSPSERAAAARALGLSEHQPALLGLLSALYDDSWEVRAAAADAAGRFGGPQAAKAIALRLDDDEASVRSRCIQALSASFDPTDSRMAEVDRARILAAAISRLADPDWRVRVAAGDFFEAHPDAGAVGPLIAALRAEKAALAQGKGRKRVFFGLVNALSRTAGGVVSTTDPEAWARWWEERKEGFTVPSRPARGGLTTTGLTHYFGIPVLSDSVIFLLDISGSMQDLCEPAVISGGPAAAPAASTKLTKLEWAKQELIATLQKLEKTDRFNLIFFETAVFPVFDGPVPATPENVAAATARIRNAAGGGGTNLYGAVEQALRIASPSGIGPFETDADTLFILSDGAPSSGLITDPKSFAAAVELANRGSRVAIHTICFGSEDPAAVELMESLARNNFGQSRRALGR